MADEALSDAERCQSRDELPLRSLRVGPQLLLLALRSSRSLRVKTRRKKRGAAAVGG